jgi:hypothetical protein
MPHGLSELAKGGSTLYVGERKRGKANERHIAETCLPAPIKRDMSPCPLRAREEKRDARWPDPLQLVVIDISAFACRLIC